MTIPGCPPNPYNFLATVVHFLTFGKLPDVDKLGRPKFAYCRLIHENCERRAHFDAGRFAMEFGDEGHRKGYCLYKLGCKGPETYANCSDHRLRRCRREQLAGRLRPPLHRLHREGRRLHQADPPGGQDAQRRAAAQYPRIVEEQGKGASFASAAALAAIAGAAAGAARHADAQSRPVARGRGSWNAPRPQVRPDRARRGV